MISLLLSLQPEGTGAGTISEKANHKPWQKQGKGKKKGGKSKPKKIKTTLPVEKVDSRKQRRGRVGMFQTGN